MAEAQSPQENSQFFFADFNTRLRDIDERNRLIRERVLLLGKNLISSRQEIEEDLEQIKREHNEIKRELEKIKRITNGLLVEFEKFVKKDEMFLIEKMLKDFQPLEFTRRKDVEEIIDKRIEEIKKEIKTTKTKE